MNLDYWGNYKGYKIYKFYGKGAKALSVTEPDLRDKVLASNGVLYYRGEVIGNVNDAGQVSNWDPDKWFHEKLDEETTWKPVPKKNKSESEPAPTKKDVDATIKLAMKRSVEDMVGERLGTYKDNG